MEQLSRDNHRVANASVISFIERFCSRATSARHIHVLTYPNACCLRFALRSTSSSDISDDFEINLANLWVSFARGSLESEVWSDV